MLVFFVRSYPPVSSENSHPRFLFRLVIFSAFPVLFRAAEEASNKGFFKCRFTLTNNASVALDYSWEVVMENFVAPVPAVQQRDGAAASRPGSASRPQTARTAAMAVRPASALNRRCPVTQKINDQPNEL